MGHLVYMNHPYTLPYTTSHWLWIEGYDMQDEGRPEQREINTTGMSMTLSACNCQKGNDNVFPSDILAEYCSTTYMSKSFKL